ncbi:hypothetical protein TSA1_21530 [Bradyrhizobium nitroreducens]|uniref:HEPN domain-containing protein n=1 Tax=Bradyrhizobium nitroreducens TaxID=709803 RepID=A0A2M6UEU6_9BRAD|nr:hypothetical protein [Bradyrhizobium nitroreducens]PIT03047.1 hypothetical protein TSA1_21530 [Bradyrhizobium nitroreducens]
MAVASAAVEFGASNLTDHGRKLIASALYSKGRSFVGASILLRKNGGDEYVVLHLLCQGLEIILKALLLFLDYKKYDKLQRKLGHDLNKVICAAIEGYHLHPLRPALDAEVKALSNLYSKHFLRYAGLQDIFIAPNSIEGERTLRRLAAVLRLANRALAKSAASPV